MVEFQLNYADFCSYGSIDSELQLIQILAWHRTGIKSLSGLNVGLDYWRMYSSPGLDEFISDRNSPIFNVTKFCHGSNKCKDTFVSGTMWKYAFERYVIQYCFKISQ